MRLTALLDLRAPRADPATLCPVEVIDAWLSTWQARPDLRRSIRRAWPNIRDWIGPRQPPVPGLSSTQSGIPPRSGRSQAASTWAIAGLA
eukprot:7749334-Pyramimonas_sp.AAC.1